MAVTIKDVKTILTQPARAKLVLVKIITSDDGLYGLGCATFTQRFHAVHAAIEQHLKPFLIGRDVDRIEEIWQMAMVNGYWRNGPVLNNAISGVDQALWDIKGKRAGMPVYQLLGGKCREAAAAYTHASGDTPEAVIDNIRRLQEEGYRYFRCQLGGYGGSSASFNAPTEAPEGAPRGAYFNGNDYMRNTLRLFERIRAELGLGVELMLDVHERLNPSDAVEFAKDMEEFKLFFLEDVLAPEDNEWFSRIRRQCATPLAMGELFNQPHEWQPLIQGRLIDFMRMHVSQMGGITPARAVATLGGMYGVRTAWHGPNDTSPVGHAANLHLDLWAPNFGVQEWCRFDESIYQLFPGLPQVRDGYMYPNEKPGLGIDIDEELAAKFPCRDEVVQWTQKRLPDGSPSRP
jgi:mannonate dehydratase